MRQTIIHETESFKVTSYGNGTAYTLAHKPDGKSVFFQGDDATRFREEKETNENAFPHEDYEFILGEIWSDYAHVATQD